MEASIFNYADPQKLNGLCKLLDMPGDLTAILTGYVPNLDLNAAAPWFAGLFSPETGGLSVQRIKELYQTEAGPGGGPGLKALTVFLLAALHTREIYGKMEIGEKIFADTLKALPRFVTEHVESYGRYGFDRHFWIYRQLALRLFRLGTLEFEICRAASGEDVLSVHIPSDAELNREALDKSYRMAGEFFSRYFPDFKYQRFYCSSWLLSPVLKEILKPGSRILTFQEDYKLTKTDLDSNGGMNWIFKREYEDFNLLPEDTSLMRGMKKILLSGRKTGSAAGFIPAARFTATYSF